MPGSASVLDIVLALVVLALVSYLLLRRSRQGAELDRTRTDLDRARDELDRLRDDLDRARATADEARAEGRRRQEQVEARLAQDRSDLRCEREALLRRETLVSDRERQAQAEHQVMDERAARLDAVQSELAGRADTLAQEKAAVKAELERVAGLSHEQAAQELLSQAEHEARTRAAAIALDIEREARLHAERQARSVIVGAIQRLAAEQTAESVVTTVDLPSDDMKGRIIGREGRNIRTFEQVTGVNVMIDDTPGSVLLSCFDPVRRETARLALTELVGDGRIHPQRIEEVYERCRTTMDERVVDSASAALAEVGISDLAPGLLPVVGGLRYRTSHGQNVLKHVVECAHLARLMAAELGLDAAFCARAAFLHDIGKALTHEHEGSHAAVGADLARRYGEHPDIVHAIEAHHNEVEPRTVEAVLTQAADAISGSRPGARRESLETYVKRLQRLEQIAASHPGVERVFAMQAGREVRVMVSPAAVDDAQMAEMARTIVRQVEDELTYPGQIRMTLVRESRAIEVAR